MNSVNVPELDIDKILYAERGGKITPNGKLERRIVANLIAHLTERGWSVCSVYDGEDDTAATDVKAAMELAFNLDECWMYFANRAGDAVLGVYFVLGNGVDVISDHHCDDGDFDAAMDAFDAEQFV